MVVGATIRPGERTRATISSSSWDSTRTDWSLASLTAADQIPAFVAFRTTSANFLSSGGFRESPYNPMWRRSQKTSATRPQPCEVDRIHARMPALAAFSSITFHYQEIRNAEVSRQLGPRRAWDYAPLGHRLRWIDESSKGLWR